MIHLRVGTLGGDSRHLGANLAELGGELLEAHFRCGMILLRALLANGFWR